MDPSQGSNLNSQHTHNHTASDPTANGSGQSSHGNSTPIAYPASTVQQRPRERKRVGFAYDGPPAESSDVFTSPNSTYAYPSDRPRDRTSQHDIARSPAHHSGSSPSSPVTANFPAVSDADLTAQVYQAFGQPYVPKPEPAIRREGLTLSDGDDIEKRTSGIQPQPRVIKSAMKMGSWSAPGSRRNSIDLITPPLASPTLQVPQRTDSIPLLDFGKTTDYDYDYDNGPIARARRAQSEKAQSEKIQAETERLFKIHTGAADFFPPEGTPVHSGVATPVEERNVEEDYVPKPAKYRGGVLGAILKLYNPQGTDSLPGGTGQSGHRRYPSALSTLSGASTVANSPQHSPPTSGYSTPVRKPWYSRSANVSSTTVDRLIGSSSMLATPGQTDLGQEVSERLKQSRPGMGKRTKSFERASLFKFKPSKEEAIRIKIHINGIVSRQRYLQKLCKALMQYGAPSHRLEEYLKMSARVLEIESQFLYLPGCMIMSFDDSTTHTTEVKLVRTVQGVDLGRLRDTHEIYKDVVHDRISVEEATKRLEEVMKRKPKVNRWVCVIFYGLASAFVGPFAFQASWIDLPMCFLLGMIVGLLQLVVAPQSDLYSNVFEITAAVITSFLARALGSIKGGNLFCFSAMAQSSIALILPGYMVLCASLELQSRHLVAGSVRMVYAIIYSLFLGFGITIGTVLYGLADKNATSATTCPHPMSGNWHFLFVPAFTLCLIVINQGKWRQVPVMLTISFTGYVVNYFSSKQFPGNLQISNTLGALAIGTLANLHARLERRINNFGLDLWENHLRPRFQRMRRGSLTLRPIPSSSVGSEPDDAYTPRMRRVGWGLAAASMLPAIFVQVPSGLAVSGSLVSGITSANEITKNATGYTTVTSAADDVGSINSVAFNVGFSVVQVAIGITVGLFLSALLVYPLGKRRSGLFSF